MNKILEFIKYVIIGIQKYFMDKKTSKLLKQVKKEEGKK